MGAWWRVMIEFVVPLLLGFMFVQALWGYATSGYEPSYPRHLEGVFGWGMLLLGAVLVAVFTAAPWRTKVDGFKPVDLDVLEGVR